MDTHKSQLNFKLCPWADWQQWHKLYTLIFSTAPHANYLSESEGICLRDLHQNDQIYLDSLVRSLKTLRVWIRKSVGSGDHIKPLKI